MKLALNGVVESMIPCEQTDCDISKGLHSVGVIQMFYIFIMSDVYSRLFMKKQIKYEFL